MALTGIPSAPNPYDPASPFEGAYAYAASLELDLNTGDGRIVYNVHPSAAASAGDPVGRVAITLGAPLRPGDPSASPPTADLSMPTLPELLAVPGFAAAFGTIAAILDGYAVQHPNFAGASITLGAP